MNVIFIEPAFPIYQREFVRGLVAVGARVIGIGERPLHHLDPELQGWLASYERISSVTDAGALHDAVGRVQAREWVDRLECTIEAHVMPAAKVREACTIPGTSVRTAYLCRDKPEMKRVLREAGVPCAQSGAADSPAEVEALIKAIGLPVIIKPRDAAGASGTWKVIDAPSLRAAINESGVRHGVSVAVEEFIEGHEGFYDTICGDRGEVVHDFISHYYPNVLEAMRTRWISPQIITTNRIDLPAYDEVKAMGAKVIEALGLERSATHMEWFASPRGLRFSEIGCRPPGVCHFDVYNAANEFDIYREWASVIAQGHGIDRPSRRYSAGIIALRPESDGHITGYSGAEAVWARYGGNIVADHFPPAGTSTQSVEAGYMANAWIRARHEDYDGCREMMNAIGESVTVHSR